MTNAQSAMRLVVYGDVTERSLKEIAYRIEDDIAALPSVSRVETSGIRFYAREEARRDRAEEPLPLDDGEIRRRLLSDAAPCAACPSPSPSPLPEGTVCLHLSSRQRPLWTTLTPVPLQDLPCICVDYPGD